jgi:hypothetical protein
VVLVLGLELSHLLVHLDHVEALHRVDDLLEGRTRQRTGLVEDQHALRKAISVGMPSMPSWPESSWFASVSSFAKVTSEYSSDAFS